MARPFTLPELDSELDSLLRRHTQAEVAQMYGVSPQAVSKAIRDRNLNAERRVSYKQYIPWRIKMDHQESYPHRMLRLWAMSENGKDLTGKQARQLERFVAKLQEDGTVVHYEPDFPAEAGGPWLYLPRREGVDLGWIRNPEVP